MSIKIILISGFLLLTSCSLLGPLDVKEQKAYLLNDVNLSTPHARTLPQTLLVTTPVADPGYNTTGMAYVLRPYQLQYYAQHRWVDTPAHMLVPLMVQSLSNTHGFAYVVAPPYTSALNLRLDTRLIELVQDFTTRPSVVHLSVQAQLIDTKTQKLIASKTFEIAQAAHTQDAPGQVQAANQAVSQFLRKLSEFVLAATH